MNDDIRSQSSTSSVHVADERESRDSQQKMLSERETNAEGGAYIPGLAPDITEQQVTMTQLRRREIQFEEAQRIARIGSWDWVPGTGESTWSDGLYRITGTDPATTPPSLESYIALIHPDDRQRVLDNRLALSKARNEKLSIEHRILRPDGVVVHVNVEGAFQYGPSGEIQRTFGTVQDISASKRIEASLRVSQERFALVSLATNDVIWDWDAATNHVWYNDAFVRRYGYPEPASGQWDATTWFSHIHPDDRGKVEQSFQQVVDSGEHYWSGEYRIRTQAGEWLEMFDRGYVMRDDSGNVVRMIGASQDITDRKRAADELARVHRQNRLVLNSTIDAIFSVDRDGRILFVNAAGTRMFGWSAAEMVGKNLHDLIHHSHPDGSPYFQEECAAHRNEAQAASHRNTDLCWRKNGMGVPVEWASNPIHDDDGNVIGLALTCTDITERLKIDQMKDEFVATVSHELRTPLTAIRGALGLLTTGKLGVFPEKAQRLLEIATANTDRLTRLINDILDLERIDSGTISLSPQPVAVDEIIQDAVECVRPLLDRAQIAALVEATPEVISLDPDRIVQTLTNLLSNAIKFSPAHSTIRVAARRRGQELLFSVSDEGRGIPSNKLESIFERFEQVDASDSRDNGGSGLGLTICRSIVRQHGGTIWAESEPGRGSTFFFTIAAPAATKRSIEGRRRVLICDDDDLARAAMRHFLEQSDFEVLEVDNGSNLLLALDQGPDAILLDLCMPEMNGFKTLTRLRSDPATADIPVVIVSILRPEEVPSVHGFHGWVPKPFLQKALVAAVIRALDGPPKPRVLLVEDDADLARVLIALFDRHGIETTHAATGREAIEIAQRIQPDLLILDLLLPDINGYSIVQSLRTDSSCRGLPLLVYSVIEPSAAQQEHLRLGPTEFLLKTRVSPEELERRVRALLDSIIRRESGDQFNAA